MKTFALMLNLPLAVLAGSAWWPGRSVPLVLAAACVIVGGLNLMLRLHAWLADGTGPRGFRLAVSDHGPVNGVLRMTALELLLSGAALLNLSCVRLLW